MKEDQQIQEFTLKVMIAVFVAVIAIQVLFSYANSV